jgi:asparagine synthase (glutamine-hydrolysing)
MQLFAVACRANGAEDEGRVSDAIRAVGAAFPRLAGGARVSGHSYSGRLVYAALAHPAAVAAPRRYSARRGDLVALFDGFPVEREARFYGADADALLDHWDELPNSLEGVFAALRVDLSADRVECLLDILGMVKVFLWRGEDRWVLSNSVAAIRKLTGAAAPDPLAVSALMSLGWPVGRSLVDEVEQLTGGYVYRLGPDELDACPTFTAEQVAPVNNPRRIASAGTLAKRMRQTLASAVMGVDEVTCAVTAGRDSRVLLGLSMSLGVPVSYYTSGVPGQPDVDIARAITARVGVSHRTVSPTVPARIDDWVGITARFVEQTDGLATLHGIGDHLDHAEPISRLGLKVWGPGGEIARGGRIGMIVPFVAFAPGIRRSWAAQRRALRTKTDSIGGVLRTSAVEATRAYLDSFVNARRAEGWRSGEVLDAYYGFERVRNWASTGVRRTAEGTDVFAPFVSRDFFEYAFSLEPGERYTEASHYRLLSELAPELRDLPYETPWKPQHPRLAPVLACMGVGEAVLARVRRLGRKPSASGATGGRNVSFARDWFEAGVQAHLELCTSVPSSPLWEFVHRRALESRLSAPPDERRGDVESLAAVMTAFWYFHGPKAAVL